MAACASASTLVLFLMVASVLAGCGSASTTLLSPTPLAGRCGVAVNVSGSSFAASGGNGTLSVQSARECTWSITERPAWVVFTAVPNPQGALEVSFTVEPNRSTSSRSGEVVIADRRTRISQEAATCPWTITPSQVSLGASGGDVRARLSTEDFCSWDVAVPSPWIVVTPERGKGSADIAFDVAVNTGDKRSGKIHIGGAVIEIDQREAPPSGPVTQAPPKTPQPPLPPAPPEPEPSLPAPAPPTPPQAPPPAPPPPAPPPTAAACTYAVSPLQIELPRKSRRFEISVATQASCALHAESSVEWLEVSPQTRTGSGKLRVEADDNRGQLRSGEIALTGDGFKTTVVVRQKGRKKGDPDD